MYLLQRYYMRFIERRILVLGCGCARVGVPFFGLIFHEETRVCCRKSSGIKNYSLLSNSTGKKTVYNAKTHKRKERMCLV